MLYELFWLVGKRNTHNDDGAKTSSVSRRSWSALVLSAITFALAATTIAIASGPGGAADQLTPIAPNGLSDQIILISTRGYGDEIGRTLNFSQTLGHEIDATSGTRTGATTHLLDDHPYAATWVFVHGNQIPPNDAICRALKVYRRLRAHSCSDQAIRFVIWSWPSERNTGRFRDALQKKYRTDIESFLLGSYIAESASRNAFHLVAYSFGARIVGGALHLSEGGQINGYHLTTRTPPRQPHRVAFLAAALADDAFAREGRDHLALCNVNRLSLMNNSRDPVLNFFWLIDGSQPHAMGDDGIVKPPCNICLDQRDWSSLIGRDHSLMEYLDRPAIMRRVSQFISAP